MTVTDRRATAVATEAALVAVTLAATLSMSRLFDGGEWVVPALWNLAAAHLLVGVVRHRRIALPVAGLLAAGVGLLVITWTSYADTTTLGIPGGETFSAMRADLDAGWSAFRDVGAPAPVEPGFTLTVSLAVWVVAFIADWAAFRLWVPFEATLPASTLFVFSSLLGTGRGRGWTTVVFAGTVLGFLLLHRTLRQGTTAHWVAGRREQGERSLVAMGGVLAVVAVFAGAVIGPRLPGATADAIVDIEDLDGDGPESRITVSPLVDIRSRLIDQSQLEAFTVRSTERAYWRLTSLDRFDGRIWSSSGSYGKASGSLDQAHPVDADTSAVRQIFSISGLSAIWLPAAYEPRAIETTDLQVRYDESSGTLIVDNDVDTSDGLVYGVTSQLARHTPEALADAESGLPSDVADRALALPDDFSPRVRQFAQSLVATAANRYEAARAIQDHLRSFTYDLAVQSGHGTDDLERFLFETQRGYCEQFAGSFAALARAAGIPARVAVGFTPGDVDPEDPQVFHVRGEHAHAWPEVYFEGAGWVAFEPTPGRGAPNAEPYTGVPETQVVSGSDGSVATTLPPTTVPGGGGGPGDTTPTSEPLGADIDAGGLPDFEPDDAADRPGIVARWWPRMAWAVGVVALLVVIYVVAVPLVDRRRRRRRRQHATTPTELVQVAWAESLETLEVLGIRPRPADTHAEVAVLVHHRVPAAGPPVTTLARVAESADYAPVGASDTDAEDAEAAAGHVAVVVREGTTPGFRMRHVLHPRRWLRRPPHQVRGTTAR